MWGYVEESQPADWLTHLTRVEDETYPSTVRVRGILPDAKRYPWVSSITRHTHTRPAVRGPRLS